MHNANDQGVASPSLTKICERTCFGRTAVIAAIRWLEDEGLVVADRSNGRHTSYSVDLNAINLFASRSGPSPEPVRLADSNQSASRTNQSASRTIPVRQADTNRHKPSRTVRSNRNTHANLEPEVAEVLGQIDPALVADFLAVRKAKRAPLTQTALRVIQVEARKAGLTLDAALRICCERNWQAFRADWAGVPQGQGGGASSAGAGNGHLELL